MATLKHAACVVVVVAAAVVAALAGAAVAAVAAVAVVAAAPVWDKPICEETIINYHQLPIKTQTTSLFGGPSYSAYSHVAGHRRGPNTPLWTPSTIHCWTSLQQPTLLHSHGSRKLGGVF